MIRKLLLPFLFFIISFFSFGQNFTDPTPSGTKTWTVPNGVTNVILEVWGAGGAGGGSIVNKDGGSGGGGGAYVNKTITVTPGDIITYSVGAGAIGTTDIGANGGNTTVSTVSGTNLVANGGLGGKKAVQNTIVLGGTGGTGSGGTTSNGSDGLSNSAAASSSTNGGTGGNSGNTGTGGAGAIGNNGGNGVAGTNPGGGGGGGAAKGSVNGLGGNGGNGQLKITYSCPTYSLTSVSTTNSCKRDNNSTVTLNSTATGLPTGNYTVTYRLSYDSYTAIYTAPMTVSTAGTGTFTADISVMTKDQTSKIKIYNIASSTCSSTLTTNNESNTLQVYVVPSKPTIQSNIDQTCNGVKIYWINDSVDAYYLDLSTDSNFSTYVSGFQDKYFAGNVINYEFLGLTNGQTYYFRIRSRNYCGTSVNSDTRSFTKIGYGSISSIGGGSSTVTVCGSTNAFTNATSGGVWSIVDGTGSASISNTGVVTGLSAGTVTVVYTVTYSGCPTSQTKSLTVTGTATNTITLSSAAGTDVQSTCSGSNITPIKYTTAGATGATFSGLPAGINGTWLSNTITISGSSTVLGTSNYTVTLVGGCGALTKSGTITINTNNTFVPSSNPNICIGVNTSSITQTTTGATGIGSPSNLPPGLTASWASNTITISGTPNTAGTYLYSIPLIGGCGTINATGTITVTANNTFAPSSNPSICIGVNTTSITQTTTGATGIGSPSNLPPGLTASWASNTITISGTPNTAGSYAYSIPLTGGCGSINATGSITVNPDKTISLTSANGTNIQTTCIYTPITDITYATNGVTAATVTGLPTGMTWSFVSNVVTITGAPSTTVGSPFNYTVNLTGCGTATASGTITVNPTNTISLSSSTGTNVQNICKGSAITNITYTTTGASGADFTGLPTGVTGSWASNTVTISGTPTTTTGGTFNYTVTLLNGCGTVTATGTITVAVPNRGQVHGGKHICLGQDSPQLYMGTYSGTIIKWQYSDDPLESNGSWVDISNTADTYQPPKLTALRTFRAVVKNGNCPAETAVQTRIDIDIQPTFTTAPSATSCPNVDVTYRTQSGLRDYIWTVPGSAGTDYTITSGGIGTSNTFVTLKWLTAGTKTVTVTYTNACSNNPVASSTTTVNEYTVSGPSLHSPFCINTQISPISHTLKGFNGVGTGSFNLPSGLNVSYDSTTKLLTISGTPTSLGTFNYSIPLTSGCAVSGQATGTITVAALPATPTATLDSSPTCANPTGSIKITGLPASGSWTLYRNSVQVATGTGSSYTDTGLTGGTAYSYQVSNASCTSEATTAITPTAVPTTKYTASGWDNGDPSNDATNLKIVIFEEDYIAENDIKACSCTVNSGNVIIKGGKTLNITNALTVNGGTLTFNDDASLLQTNPTALNSGAINYKRKSVDIRLADYVYWSSPVENFKIGSVSPLTSQKYLFSNNGTNWVNEPSSRIMVPGKGYIVRGPDNITNSTRVPFEATFTGAPNNGNIDGEIVKKDQFYLVGNPYPSALDADEFLDRNKTILEGTLYFWTHNTPVVLGGAYEYSSDDYATYNLSGGSGTGPGKAAPSGDDDDDTEDDNNNENVPSGFIGAGQSFFTGIAANGQIKFDNDMRAGANTNGQFFKPGKTAKTTALEKHRVWLNMTNAKGAFKQILVGYIQGASNSYERFYDGTTLDGNKYVDFYSVNDGNNLVIQGRALPFADTDTVPLGYRSTLVGDFTIGIDHADGNLNTQTIYLEDKTTGKIHDLTAANYTFTTEKGTFNDRFVLRYTNKTLGTGDFENVENGLLVSVKNKAIKVTSAKESIKEVVIYDITGKQLYTKTKIGATEFEISNLQSANQVLLVKITLENDYLVTKKIVFQ